MNVSSCGLWSSGVAVVKDTQFPVGKEHTLNSIAGDYYSQIDCTSHASMLIAFYK